MSCTICKDSPAQIYVAADFYPDKAHMLCKKCYLEPEDKRFLPYGTASGIDCCISEILDRKD